MGNLVKYAKREMEIAGLYGPNAPYGGMFPEAVLKIVETFAGEGHSGNSAHICIQILEKVLRFEPLTALTGADDEWHDVSEYGDPDQMAWQNVRCPYVFKRKDGTAYDSSGKSRKEISFPYMPGQEAD